MTQAQFIIDKLNFLEIVFNKKYTKEQKNIYAEYLQDINEKDLENGINKLIKAHTFNYLPNIADIRKYATEDEKKLRELYIFEIREVIVKITDSFKYNPLIIVHEYPLVHFIIKKLGGIEILAKYTPTSLKDLLDKKLESLIDAYQNQKIKVNSIPLYIGYARPFTSEGKERKHVNILGNPKNVEKWVTHYLNSKYEINIKKLLNNFNDDENAITKANSLTTLFKNVDEDTLVLEALFSQFSKLNNKGVYD